MTRYLHDRGFAVSCELWKACQECIEPRRFRCCIGSGCFVTEQRKTARGTASTLLFFVVVEPPEHRISAGKETSMADNSLPRTAKTAGPTRRPPTPSGARCECV